MSSTPSTPKIGDDIESHNNYCHQHRNGTTFLRTCFNGINALSGVGILAIPYALSKGGWLSIILLLTVSIICFYTGVLLRRCILDSNSPHVIETYPDIGAVAFGRKGRIIVSIFMYLELYLVAVGFLILEGDNLAKLFPRAGELLAAGGIKISVEKGFIILTALAVLPSTLLRSLGLLAYVSVGGVLASIILVCSVFWVGAFDGVGFHGQGRRLWNWSGLPTALSLFTFCYCGHAVFPTLCNSMQDRTQFTKVLIVCFSISTVTYGSMAIFGYLMYGENLNPQVTLNLPIEKIGSLVAIYTTLVNPLTKYALVVCPIAEALESKCPPSYENRLSSILIRTVLVLSTLIVALIVPFFGNVMAFTGAFLSVTVTILFPCLCYLKIHQSQILRLEIMFIVVIFILGALAMVLGTYVSLRDIINEFRKY